MNSRSSNAKKCLIYKPRSEAKISSLTMSWTHPTSAPFQSGQRGREERRKDEYEWDQTTIHFLESLEPVNKFSYTRKGILQL